MKQARKVALVHCKDFPREQFSAYWEIGVTGSDEDGYRWHAKLMSYDAVAWEHEGKRTPERPDLPRPAYPSDSHLVRQAEYERMSPAQQASERARQDAFRAECARIWAANPRPVHLIEEAIDVAPTRDEADTAAQQWVLSKIGAHKRPPKPLNPQSGHALVLGPLDLLGTMLGEIARRLLRPVMLALAYATATRANMLQTIIDAIDAGPSAGLWRIYDGSRPATCGAATTLGAELTCSDPSATKSGGLLTFSAITADASANANITATWFRLVDSTATCAHDGNVGTSGSDLNLNSTSIATGQQVSITSATITEGNP